MLATIKAYATAIIAVLCMLGGAAIVYFVYAVPRIDSLQKTIEKNKADDAQAAADFRQQSERKQKEIQDAADEAAMRFQAMQVETGKRIAALSADGQRLRSTIAAYAVGPYALRLPPPGQSGPGIDERAVLLGGLLEDCNDLLVQGAGNAQSAANQIRALEDFIQQ